MPTYVVKSNGNIEHGSSTWGKIRSSGSDVYIEKGSSTIGKVVNRSGTWVVESSGGSSLGCLKGTRIEKGAGGSTIGSLSEAKSFCDGPDHVAMALWVLHKEGKF